MASPKELTALFRELLRTDTLSHGYLLFGTGARGEAAFSCIYDLAAFLESASRAEQVLLDAKVLGGADAGIDQIRDAIRFLWERPLRSSRKTLIIHDADLLTIPAEQALLKALEEPPSYALIVLIAKDASGIIPPLASRLQKIYVSGPETSVVSAEAMRIARALLTAETVKARSETLKGLMEQEELIAPVVKELMGLLQKDAVKNSKLLSALTRRWGLMERFTTNRKLQLEAAFAEGLGH